MSEFRNRGRSFRRIRCVHDFATFPALRLCLFPVRQGNQPGRASPFPCRPEDGLRDCMCCPEDGRVCGANAGSGFPQENNRLADGAPKPIFSVGSRQTTLED